MKKLRVCAESDVPPGGAKTINADGGEIAVFNAGGAFHAMDNTCPHRGAPLSEGRLDGCVVTCPWHGWQFDVTTGQLLMSAGSPQKTYKVVQKSGDLFVEIP